MCKLTPGFTDKKLVKGAQIQEATTPSLKVPRVQLAMTGRSYFPVLPVALSWLPRAEAESLKWCPLWKARPAKIPVLGEESADMGGAGHGTAGEETVQGNEALRGKMTFFFGSQGLFPEL